MCADIRRCITGRCSRPRHASVLRCFPEAAHNSGMTVIPINRQPKGVPVGGQFAAAAHAESSVSLGRHAAATTSNRHVPESLRMAHFQDPRLVDDLAWEVERSTAGVSDGEMDYRAECFSDKVPHLHVEEAYNYFNQAQAALVRGDDWKAIVAEAAAADTAAHPGGAMKDGYLPPVLEHQPG